MSTVTATATAAEAPPMDAPDSPATLGDAIWTFTRYLSPRLLALYASTALAARLWVGDWSGWDALIPLAVIACWPFQEWLIHVFVLHFKPFRLLGRTVDLPVAASHRAHHRDPWRLPLIFVPTHVVLLAPLALVPAWLLLMPTLALGLTGLASYLLMSLHYEWVHYLVHTRYTPRSWLYKRLWKHHRLHHFKNEHYWYGVTMLSGDKVLATAPDHKDVPLSPTCRTLGVMDDGVSA